MSHDAHDDEGGHDDEHGGHEGHDDGHDAHEIHDDHAVESITANTRTGIYGFLTRNRKTIAVGAIAGLLAPPFGWISAPVTGIAAPFVASGVKNTYNWGKKVLGA